jgi:hypothetical protein
MERSLESITHRDPTGETPRALRAVEVLENLATRQARGLLRTIPDGAAGAHLTREAKPALGRSQKRAVPGR